MSKRSKSGQVGDEFDLVVVCSSPECVWFDDGRQERPRMVCCSTCPAMCCPLCFSHLAVWHYPKGELWTVRELLARRRALYSSAAVAGNSEVRH